MSAFGEAWGRAKRAFSDGDSRRDSDGQGPGPAPEHRRAKSAGNPRKLSTDSSMGGAVAPQHVPAEAFDADRLLVSCGHLLKKGSVRRNWKPV